MPKNNDKKLEELENEIQLIRSDILGCRRDIQRVDQKVDQLSITYQYHNHNIPSTMPIFMRQIYEQDLKMSQKQQQMAESQEDEVEE